MAKMMSTTITSAIERFSVEKGMTIVADALVELGCERREKRTKISEPMKKRTVRLAAAMWTY